jgi:hypothetical protein
MRNINHSSKKAICSICATLVLCTVAAHATALPPDLDNAALLYYQAILHRPDADEGAARLIHDVLHGAEPNEKVREYLNLPRSQETIELVKAATQISHCNWGLLYSPKCGLHPEVISHIVQLCYLMELNARTLAADGDYRGAFGQCLGMRRFAAHIGDGTDIIFSISTKVNIDALMCVQHVLGSMQPDADTLTWLRHQLVAVEGTPWQPARTLKSFRDRELQFVRMHPEAIPGLAELVSKAPKDESTSEELDEMLARARELWDEVLESALQIIGSDMDYEDKYAELRKLTDNLEARANSYDLIAHLCRSACWVGGYYNLMVRNAGYFNATRAAIEIYLVKATTGQLPKTLPHGLAKDPYSGKDFEYEITKEGFVLRCRVKPLNEREVRQYEFKVKRQGQVEGEP